MLKVFVCHLIQIFIKEPKINLKDASELMHWSDSDGDKRILITLYFICQDKNIKHERNYNFKKNTRWKPDQMQKEIHNLMKNMRTEHMEETNMSKINAFDNLIEFKQDNDIQMIKKQPLKKMDQIFSEKYMLQCFEKKKNLIKEQEKQLTYKQVDLFREEFQNQSLYALYFPHLNEKEVKNKNLHIFKLFNPRIQIKCKGTQIKEDKRPFTICITNEVDKKLSKQGFTMIFKEKWVNYCALNKRLIFKFDMTKYEKSLLMHQEQEYYANYLPGINTNNKQQNIININNKKYYKKNKNIMERMSITQTVKAKKKN